MPSSCQAGTRYAILTISSADRVPGDGAIVVRFEGRARVPAEGAVCEQTVSDEPPVISRGVKARQYGTGGSAIVWYWLATRGVRRFEEARREG